VVGDAEAVGVGLLGRVGVSVAEARPAEVAATVGPAAWGLIGVRVWGAAVDVAKEIMVAVVVGVGIRGKSTGPTSQPARATMAKSPRQSDTPRRPRRRQTLCFSDLMHTPR